MLVTDLRRVRERFGDEALAQARQVVVGALTTAEDRHAELLNALGKPSFDVALPECDQVGVAPQ